MHAAFCSKASSRCLCSKSGLFPLCSVTSVSITLTTPCSGLSFLPPTNTDKTSQKEVRELHVCLLESLKSDHIPYMLFGRVCISYRKQPRKIRYTIVLFFKASKSLNFITMLCAFCWHKNRVELNKYFLSCVPGLSKPLCVG